MILIFTNITETINYRNNGDRMIINNELELVKLFGWSIFSKINYVHNELKRNKTKSEIKDDCISQDTMKSKTFENIWNRYNKIKDSIEY